LSEQILDTEPSVSTAGSRRMMAFLRRRIETSASCYGLG
jgi:hypothetical protein